jgi:hypothetical protein
MTPKTDHPEKRFFADSIEKLGIIDLFPIKSKSHTYYVTIKPIVMDSYDLMTGDVLKLQIVEARKHREKAEAPAL